MIGTDLNLDLPSLSDTLSTIVSKLVTALSSVEDSIADKATPAALDINTNLSFGGYHATNLGGLVLATGNAPTSAGSFYYSGGNFYLKDAVGTIQLSSNGSINLSAIGAIGGDYGTGPESLDYSLSAEQYQLKASATTWADMVVDDVLLMEPAGANFIRLSAPTLAADYTVTLPSALPATQKLLQIEADGDIVASNVLGADENITLSGTGEVKHGERTIVLPFGSHATWITGTLSVVNNWAGAGTGVAWRASAGSFGMIHLPMLQVGWRLKKIKVIGSGGAVSLGLGVTQYDGDAGATATYTTTGPAYVATIDGGGWTVGSSSAFDTNTDVDVVRLELSPAAQTDFTAIAFTYDVP